MIYKFECKEHGIKEVNSKASQYTSIQLCPECKMIMKRVFSALVDVWNCEGRFGKTK